MFTWKRATHESSLPRTKAATPVYLFLEDDGPAAEVFEPVMRTTFSFLGLYTFFGSDLTSAGSVCCQPRRGSDVLVAILPSCY